MEQSKIIDEIKSDYPIKIIEEMLGKLKTLKVMVIGDTIVDEYHYTLPKGRATKDPILSVDYVNSETYAGGILAIANHVSNFVDSVACVTVLGEVEDRRAFIEGAINKNVNTKFFVKKNSPTTVKKRFLNLVRNEKLFKVEYINDKPLPTDLENELIEYLERELPKYDIVLVGDFGHGMLTERLINTIEAHSKFLAVNAQCNSANLGFNYVTKYKLAEYLTLDLQELQYAVADRFSEVSVLMDKLHEKAKFNRFLVTLGKSGSCYYQAGKKTFFPAFGMRPKDTVGAGDAVFSITSLLAYLQKHDLLPFIANCVGGIAVSYMGNKEYVTKSSLIDFIAQAYKGTTM